MYNLLNIYGNGSRHIRMLFDNNTIIVFVISFILHHSILYFMLLYIILQTYKYYTFFFYSHICISQFTLIPTFIKLS